MQRREEPLNEHLNQLTEIEDALIKRAHSPIQCKEIPIRIDVNEVRSSASSDKDSSFCQSSNIEKSVLPTSIEPWKPEIEGSLRLKRFKYITLTFYRKIFTTIFTINAITLVIFIIKSNGAPSRSAANTASSANLMVGILARQENFVNMLYDTAVRVPHSVPLFIRRRIAKVFHYGGIHSGCGTAATVWFLLQSGLVTIDWIREPSTWDLIDLTTSWSLILLLLIILFSAYPTVRRKFHNIFEMLHRFAGWLALAIFWAHAMIVALEPYRRQQLGVSRSILTLPSLWLLLVSTGCGVLSWSRMRLHDVYPEKLSGHAIRLHFKYKDMPPSYGLKVSDKPLLEWHSFATIPNADGGFSVLVSNAGDWTSKIINNPPTKLWVRGYPVRGVSYTSKIFKRVVIVATGTGIGPILSVLYAKATPCRILWSAPNPLTTYGQKIIDSVRDADPNAIIWNSREHGRPDLVGLAYQLVREFDAEAVFVISNPVVSETVVLQLNSRNIATYGVLFDS